MLNKFDHNLQVSGVYKIVCSVDGRFYVGSSKNIRHRLSTHQISLRKGEHYNLYFQRAFSKYGEDNFYIEVHKVCDNYLEEEQLVINKNFDLGLLFNLSKNAGGGDIISYHPDRKNIIARMQDTIHKNLDTMTEEEKKAKWGLPGEFNGMFGKHHTAEAKEKDRQGHLGKPAPNLGVSPSEDTRKKLSESAKLRTGEKNSFHGRTHSKETKEVIAKKALGRKPSNTMYYRISDECFEGLTEASRVTGIPPVTIHWRVKSLAFPDYFKITWEEYMAWKKIKFEVEI